MKFSRRAGWACGQPLSLAVSRHAEDVDVDSDAAEELQLLREHAKLARWVAIISTAAALALGLTALEHGRARR